MGGFEGACCVAGIRAKGDVKVLSQEYRSLDGDDSAASCGEDHGKF